MWKAHAGDCTNFLALKHSLSSLLGSRPAEGHSCAASFWRC
ncbi:hypothetical protein ACP4OV_010733 [Aristida adscensionis]